MARCSTHQGKKTTKIFRWLVAVWFALVKTNLADVVTNRALKK